MDSAAEFRAYYRLGLGLMGTDTPEKMWSYTILQQEKQNPRVGG
jgi:hypothetical protein